MNENNENHVELIEDEKVIEELGEQPMNIVNSDETTEVEKNSGLSEEEAIVAAVDENHVDSNESNTNKKVDIFNKIKLFFSNKRNAGIVGIVAVIMLGIFIFVNGPKSIVNDVEVKFDGYDERGTLSYNEVAMRAKIYQIIAEKNGIKADISNTTNTLNSLADLAKGIVSGNNEYYKKLSNAEQQAREISITFDKQTVLKNGDVVTMTISTGKDSPIKAEKKQFTVTGLKDVVKIDSNALLLENPITFNGYNNYGSVKYNTEVFKLNQKINNDLKNGQQLVFTILESYSKKLLQEGKVLTGDTTISVEVKDLKELSTISNIDTVFEKVSDFAQSKYANKTNSSYTYAIEKKQDFIAYTPENNNSYFKSDAEFSAVSIYKVNEKYSSSFGGNTEENYYVVVGYDELSIYDNTIILSDLSSNEYYSYSKYTDETSVAAFLRSKGYVEYSK